MEVVKNLPFNVFVGNKSRVKTLNNVASVLALSHHESTPVVTTVDPTIVPIPFSSNCMIPFSSPSVYVQYPMWDFVFCVENSTFPSLFVTFWYSISE